MKSKLFPHNIWQAVIAFLLPIIVLAPILLMTDGHLEKDLESTLLFVLLGIGYFLFVFLINKKRNIQMRYSLKWPKAQWLLLLFGIVVFFQIGINNPLFKLLSDLLDKPISVDYSWVYILGAILIGPIVEEVIFRGIILKGFLSNYSPRVAILLSTVLFSLVHVQSTQLLGAFIMGLFFAWVFYRTENLILVIILHSLANMTSFLSNYLLSSPYFIPVSILILLLFCWKMNSKIKDGEKLNIETSS